MSARFYCAKDTNAGEDTNAGVETNAGEDMDTAVTRIFNSTIMFYNSHKKIEIR